MYSTNRIIISLLFILFLVHVPRESSANYLNSTKETNLRNGFCPSINEDGLYYAVSLAGELQRTCASRYTSIKNKPRNVESVFQNANNLSLTNRSILVPLRSRRSTWVSNIGSPSSGYTDFGMPYDTAALPSNEDDIFMIVPNGKYKNDGIQKDMWIFAKAISWGVWIEMGMTSIIVGVVIKYMEYRVDNAEFSGPLLSQFFMLLWFPFSVLVFHEGHIANKWSKGIIFIWLCMAFMVIQCFIANLFSLITNHHSQQFFPTYIGYIEASVKQIIQQFGFYESHLKLCSSIEECQLALSRGSYNGGVDAIFDRQLPVDLFINSYGSEYIKIGPIRKAIMFGYAFSPLGSEDHFNFPIISQDVDDSLNVGELRKRSYKQYHNLYAEPPSFSSQTQSLSAYNFGGIFIITWILIILVVLFSEFSIWRKSTKILVSNSVEATIHSTSEMIEVHEDLNTIETLEDTSTSSGTNEEELTQEE